MHLHFKSFEKQEQTKHLKQYMGRNRERDKNKTKKAKYKESMNLRVGSLKQ